MGAALVGTEATGARAVDVVLCIAFAVTVTLAASTARSWSLAFAAGVIVLASTSDLTALVVATLVFAAAAAVAGTERAGPVWATALGAVLVQIVLRLPATGPRGLTAMAGAVALGPVVISGARNASPDAQRITRRIAIGLGALGLVAVAMFITAALLARSHLQTGVVQAKAGIEAARQGRTGRAQQSFDVARRELATARARLSSPLTFPDRFVPVLAQNARGLRTLVRNAEDLVVTGSRAAREADVNALRLRNGRIDPASIDGIRAPLHDVEATLARRAKTLANVPTLWLVPPLRNAVDELRARVDTARDSARTARIGIDAAPWLLGTDTPRRYFLAFTTPAETRAASGLMGNWGILSVADGRFELSAFGRTGELNAGGADQAKTITEPADYLVRYARFSPAREWRNLTMSPDFPTVARVAQQLAPQSGVGPIDGVIAIDPVGLAALLQLTGPVSVAGRAEPLTADNAAQFLLRDQYVEFGTTARIDFLADAAETVTNRLLTSDLPGPRTVGRVLSRAARGGHLQVDVFDRGADRLFGRLDVRQTLAPRSGTDFAGLVTQNAIGNKIDLFLHRSLRLRSTVDPATGRIRSTVDIRLRNDAPESGLPDYVIGNDIGLPPGTNRLYVSFYTPLAATAASLDGVATAVESQIERGFHVYSRYVTLAPGARSVLRLELRGDAPVETHRHRAPYVLRLLHQVTVNPDTVDVRVHTTAPGGFGPPASGFVIRKNAAWFRAAVGEDRTLSARFRAAAQPPR